MTMNTFISVMSCEGQRQLVFFFLFVVVVVGVVVVVVVVVVVLFWFFVAELWGGEGPQTVKIKAKINLKCDKSYKTNKKNSCMVTGMQVLQHGPSEK